MYADGTDLGTDDALTADVRTRGQASVSPPPDTAPAAAPLQGRSIFFAQDLADSGKKVIFAGETGMEPKQMGKEEITKKWLEQVDEDILAAEALYEKGRWLYIGFMCHQAIEKLIKAYWLTMRDDEPIYVHNHFRLLEGCGLKNQLSDTQRRFIEIISPMYIAARYPEYKSQVARMLNEKGSASIIEQTKEFKQWILQKCSQETKSSTLCDDTNK